MHKKTIEVTEVLGDALLAFKAKWKDVVVLAMIYLALGVLMFLGEFFIRNLLVAITNGGTWANFGYNILAGTQVVLLGLASIVMLVAALWLSAAMLFLAVDEAKDWAGALRLGWKKMWSVAWLACLNALLILSGFIALVIPGFILLTVFSVAGPVLAKEKLGAWSAMKRSTKYVRGHGWPVFIVIFFSMVIALLINILFSLLLGLFGLPLTQVVHDQVVGNLSGLIITPLAALIAYQVYLRLKA